MKEVSDDELLALSIFRDSLLCCGRRHIYLQQTGICLEMHQFLKIVFVV